MEEKWRKDFEKRAIDDFLRAGKTERLDLLAKEDILDQLEFLRSEISERVYNYYYSLRLKSQYDIVSNWFNSESAYGIAPKDIFEEAFEMRDVEPDQNEEKKIESLLSKLNFLDQMISVISKNIEELSVDLVDNPNFFIQEG